MKEKRNNRGSGKGRIILYYYIILLYYIIIYIYHIYIYHIYIIYIYIIYIYIYIIYIYIYIIYIYIIYIYIYHIYIYIYIIYIYIIIYIISTHIRLIHTYPYTSNLFKTIQNCSKAKNPQGIDVVLAFPWPHLPFRIVSEALWVPVVFFALAPPVLALEAPVLVIFLGKTHSQGDVATWRMFWCLLEHAIDDVRNTFHLLWFNHCIVRLECKQLFHAVLMHDIQVPIVGHCRWETAVVSYAIAGGSAAVHPVSDGDVHSQLHLEIVENLGSNPPQLH